jgi:DNA-binding transcriptional MerR regulator
MAHALTVGQLARATGVPAKTMRYYEQVDVLPAPRRSATGYRQYAQRDVHRLLFIRRARALGLSLPSLKALLAELDGGQCLTMRPHLMHLVTEHLRTVRQQVAECQLLEQQLAQVLQRLLTLPPSEHTDGCRCLEIDVPAVPGTAQQPSPFTSGGYAMSTPTTLESLTELSTTKGSCGCGCGCDDDGFVRGFQSVAVMLPSAMAAEPDTRDDDEA